MKKIFISLTLILITQSVFADMSCDTGVSKYFAGYEPNQHTCSSGYYMPANTDGCRACTYGHTCPGGTYTFNETDAQGLAIGSYACGSGYFLPANSDTCTVHVQLGLIVQVGHMNLMLMNFRVYLLKVCLMPL